jgi:hypothetical protein
VDAVFVFGAEGMEVWCLVEDDKSYGRFSGILAPLERSHQVELYATYPTKEEKKKPEDPPPSLWNNLELRAFLRDPSVIGFLRQDVEMVHGNPIGGRRNFFMRQRLMLYAAETLEWARTMRRFATCLPATTGVAFDSTARQDVRDRAVPICRDHAREVAKHAGKIMNNLARALPKLPKRADVTGTANAESAAPSPQPAANQICASAQSVSQSIYRFFYPRNHSVQVVDLKESRLLDSLTKLQDMASEFELSLLKSRRD